nr:hypothetical protein [Desulfobacula sp.]
MKNEITWKTGPDGVSFQLITGASENRIEHTFSGDHTRETALAGFQSEISDDFGLLRHGFAYSVNGGDSVLVELLCLRYSTDIKPFVRVCTIFYPSRRQLYSCSS